MDIDVSQGWLGRDDDPSTSHGQGLAYLLKAAARENWKAGFETEMILTFCVPVVGQSPLITNRPANELSDHRKHLKPKSQIRKVVLGFTRQLQKEQPPNDCRKQTGERRRRASRGYSKSFDTKSRKIA